MPACKGVDVEAVGCLPWSDDGAAADYQVLVLLVLHATCNVHSQDTNKSVFFCEVPYK